MKPLFLLLAALLALPGHAFAAEPIRIDIYLAGQLEHIVTLAGANSSVRISPKASPNTTLELRLIAPEPLIVEVRETSTDSESVITGRAKILASENSFALAEIKGVQFRNPYVLVRHD